MVNENMDDKEERKRKKEARNEKEAEKIRKEMANYIPDDIAEKANRLAELSRKRIALVKAINAKHKELIEHRKEITKEIGKLREESFAFDMEYMELMNAYPKTQKYIRYLKKIKQQVINK